jgi:hypothetical protein
MLTKRVALEMRKGRNRRAGPKCQRWRATSGKLKRFAPGRLPGPARPRPVGLPPPKRLFNQLPHKLALARPNSIKGTLSIELSHQRRRHVRPDLDRLKRRPNLIIRPPHLRKPSWRFDPPIRSTRPGSHLWFANHSQLIDPKMSSKRPTLRRDRKSKKRGKARQRNRSLQTACVDFAVGEAAGRSV